MGWLEDALAGAPADAVDRYRASAEYLNRALAGADDRAKIAALRAMANLGITPDDRLNVVLALLGYFSMMGEAVPDAMRSVADDVERLTERFGEETTAWGATAKVVLDEIIDRVREHAIELGKVGVQSAAIEEVEKQRYRLALLTNESLKAIQEDMAEQARKGADRSLVRRERVIGAIVAAIIVVVSIGVGWVVSSVRAPVQQQQVRDGQAYERMWADPRMPESMRAWIRQWSARP